MDDVSEKITFNIWKLNINKEKESIGVDLRIPVTYKKEDFVAKLEAKGK